MLKSKILVSVFYISFNIEKVVGFLQKIVNEDENNDLDN